MSKCYPIRTISFCLGGGGADCVRDADRGQQDHPPAGGAVAFRDEKQETMVVRPYPQVQTHSQTQAVPQTVSIQPGTPVTLPAASVHLQQGQPAVLTEGQMKVMLITIMLIVNNTGICCFCCGQCEMNTVKYISHRYLFLLYTED